MEWNEYAAFIQRLLSAPNEATARRILRASNLITTTDELAEGLLNLYFTTARARAAAVADAIVNGVADVAPSQNAVFDALALKQDADAQLTSLAGLSYTGNTLKVVRVNAAETAFELATPAASGQAAIQFKDEGVNVGSSGAITSLDFVGADVAVTVVGTAATATFTSAGGGLSIGAALQLPNLPTFL